MNSIILIGMPNSGKSTVGNILSSKLELPQKDTDIMITEYCGKIPKDIVAESGREEFLKIQEEIVLKSDFTNNIVSTGGGIIYSPNSMGHLKNFGKVYFLYSNFEDLSNRMAPGRPLSGNNHQSFFDLYNEREPMYRGYADYIIECKDKSEIEISEEIIKLHKK